MAAPKSEMLENMQIAFARLVGEQLDQLGFPSGSERAPALCKLLGIPRSQTYRLLRGLAFPSVENMLKLQQAGVSIDEAIADLAPDAAGRETLAVTVNGTALPAQVRLRAEGTPSRIGLLPPAKGRPAELCLAGSDRQLPPKARPLFRISFPNLKSLAIIEDDPATLQTLSEGCKKRFQIFGFETAGKFLKSDLSAYDVILLDWNLPDMAGEQVIRRIREVCQTPVFILTGDLQASAAIVKAMSDQTVHHVAKPTDLLILNKRLGDAVNGS